MRFDPPLIEGKFLRRYKRFFVDVQMPDGEVIVAHCPNTGTLLGCLKEGAPVLLHDSQNPARKLRYTWTMIRPGRAWVGVHTGNAVPLVQEAIDAGVIEELTGYERQVTEVVYGREGKSRIDVLLSRGGEPDPTSRRKGMHQNDERVYVEVKSTTLVRDGEAAFPDAVTTRGQKHLQELVHVVESGQRAAMVYCVQRSDCDRFAPADDIDPRYGQLLREALAAGVEAYAIAGKAGKRGVVLDRRLPIELPS